MIRVLVTGDRKWSDYAMIKRQLQIFLPSNESELTIIHGGAKGADALAAIAGKVLGMKVLCWEADWKTYGKAAGPIRNQKMLNESKPDVVLAFHDNIHQSKGTKDMVTRAQKARIPVYIFSHNWNDLPKNWYLGDIRGEQI